MIPNKLFFTKGVGRHKEYLNSFELALRDAGIAHCNLVYVSSIFPPGCKIIPKSQGLQFLKPGQIVYVVMSKNSTNEPNRLIASSIGCAIPANGEQYGYLSEHHSFGETDEKAGEYAEGLAVEMLASTLGLEIDPNKSWDEHKKEWKLQDKIVKTTNITQSAEGDKNGLWTTVIAAAVLIVDEQEAQQSLRPPKTNSNGQPSRQRQNGPDQNVQSQYSITGSKQ